MKKLLPYIALVLALAEGILMLLSWLLSAALPASGVRSMLSSEGIRWLMGHFSKILSTPLLSCLLLAAIAVGCLLRSGITQVSQMPRLSYRSQRALWMGMAVLLACVVVMLLLTAIPHAILLSATGDLFPSPFSASLIPVAAFSVCASSIVYGIVAGTFQSLSDVYNALLYGIRWAAPVFLFYILVMQLYGSLRFVFG
jgi:aminobenzoyl-glutamate transport protein